jgi:hypothetical protein
MNSFNKSQQSNELNRRKAEINERISQVFKLFNNNFKFYFCI